MKRCINGKVYDTSTASCVGTWEVNADDRLNHCAESLYRKRTGEFFLHGEGGSRSKYARSLGNDRWGGGEQIIPLTYEAAVRWAETHLTAEAYDAIFGAIPEADEDEGGKSTLTLYLSGATIARAKRSADQLGLGLSAYVGQLIDNAVSP